MIIYSPKKGVTKMKKINKFSWIVLLLSIIAIGTVNIASQKQGIDPGVVHIIK